MQIRHVLVEWLELVVRHVWSEFQAKNEQKQQNTWLIDHLAVDFRRHARNLNLKREQPTVSKIIRKFS